MLGNQLAFVERVPERYGDLHVEQPQTLHVLGKGRKTRSIPLPATCVPVLQSYRQPRGLPPQPNPYEQAPLIHGLKDGSLLSRFAYSPTKCSQRVITASSRDAV